MSINFKGQWWPVLENVMAKINGELKIIGALGATVAKVATATGLIAFGSGCTQMQQPQHNFGSVAGYDRVTFETAEGIRADGDRTVGLIRTSKEDGKRKSQYLEYREKQDKEVTVRESIRANAPQRGFMSGLFGGGRSNSTSNDSTK